MWEVSVRNPRTADFHGNACHVPTAVQYGQPVTRGLAQPMLIVEAATARHPLGTKPCVRKHGRHGSGTGHRPGSEHNIRRSDLAGCSCSVVMFPSPVEPVFVSSPPFVTRFLPLLAKALLAGTESRYVSSDVLLLAPFFTCPFWVCMCRAAQWPRVGWACQPASLSMPSWSAVFGLLFGATPALSSKPLPPAIPFWASPVVYCSFNQTQKWHSLHELWLHGLYSTNPLRLWSFFSLMEHFR